MHAVRGRSTLPGAVHRADDVEMLPDHHSLDLLSEQECLDLLRTRSLGRLGLSAGALPYVLPVRYVLDDHRILVGTGEDTPLSAACDGAVVAFQADGFDGGDEEGWSVVVQGLARSLATAPRRPEVEQVLGSWLRPLPARCVSIPIGVMSGQRLRAPGSGSPGAG